MKRLVIGFYLATSYAIAQGWDEWNKYLHEENQNKPVSEQPPEIFLLIALIVAAAVGVGLWKYARDKAIREGKDEVICPVIIGIGSAIAGFSIIYLILYVVHKIYIRLQELIDIFR